MCRCVDGTVTCTDKDCGLDNGVKEGCNLEGKFFLIDLARVFNSEM